ncbi:hypothetical protein DN752_14265 [Echinicola strongylocentroti]|uniref:Beta-hexosaminidase bacterial type N-terminal domain-containing protein n=1 Tax=Echinicola strongylocentroti TaxID=1795355 RepID=A0A2Z4IQ40_9BACT|nr:hypothetical protein [Echinicola strongylocentroti]AWW33192.1 hypothetical protein DN752_14265 [Echinicola strongylocentroti]
MKLLTPFLFLILLIGCQPEAEQITILLSENASNRANFGAEKLTKALEASGAYTVQLAKLGSTDSKGKTIVVAEQNDPALAQWKQDHSWKEPKEELAEKEAFQISSARDNILLVEGVDPSGALYGADELSDQLKETGKIDFQQQLTDGPEMVLRGACIGLQKLSYLPGRGVYEYPYTPENFPWFYDKEHWIDYLDMLVENRMNSLYLWNGHPFASLVRLEDYPFAVEVDDETFKKNEEMFRFITEEADKRGIWVIQMFYNIIVSKPFAEHYGIETQDRSRPIIPYIADYTQKSIAAFIEKYPNVGLLVALGEAMSGEENDVKWFTETIIPGVQDGLKAIGRTDEPPIILRAHDTNAPLVMEKALPLYKNLYTTHKYNGESLTTYQPRGPWTAIHKSLSAKGNIHISNVHILANLEPFRYGSPDFIQKSVQAMHDVHGANALHLYPQASYWDWPYTADKTESGERLLQIDRDWIWYKAWGRYAWDCRRSREDEMAYWGEVLGEEYGAGKEAGRQILTAYEETGEIAPKLLRKFGITEGNRQTLLLGMFGSQLVNPYKWRVYPGFHSSCGPLGEILIEYAEKEQNGAPHEGEIPPQLIEEVVAHGRKAVEAIDAAAPSVKANEEEFARLRNDVHSYNVFAQFFSEKVKGAMEVLEFKYSGDVADLEEALPHLEKSVAHYRDLVELTKDAYLYANSMQTSMRRIPIGGDEGNNKHWVELLPHYEKELASFKRNIALLKDSKDGQRPDVEVTPWKTVEVDLGLDAARFSVREGQKVFTDDPGKIIQLADELKSLKGWMLSSEKLDDEGITLEFHNDQPIKLVMGYFNTGDKHFLTPPTLETNAMGNMRGEAEVQLANALQIEGLPPVNIHTYEFEAGENKLTLQDGKVLFLGAIDANQEITSRDVGLIDEEQKVAVDWVFY